MAEGIVLNLDGNLMSQLAAADKAIEKLGTTADTTGRKISQTFTALADTDIQKFINALDTAKSKMRELGNAANFSSIAIVGNQAVSSIDGVNRLTEAMAKLNAVGRNSDDKSGFTSVTGANAANEITKKTYQALNREIKKMQKSLEKLDEAQANYGMSVTTVVQRLREVREAQRRLNEEAKRAARTSADEVAENAKRARTMNELKAAAKDLKNTMNNLNPKSPEWARLNRVYQETNKRIKEIEASMKGVKAQHSKLINTSDQLARKLALVFSVSAITGYVNKLIEVRGEFELQQRSLESILQNKDEADKLWNKTVQLAVKSPFRVGELVSYTKQLAAYRVETEKLYDTNKRLADVSAGLGVDMGRLILAFGQVKAANYLRGTELRQFSEAGINILGELSKYFTEIEGRAVSVGDVFEMVSNRMVKFSDVEEIFKRITDQGGIFYNMQEIQSKTLKGLISNLKDSIDIMFNDIGKANDGVLKNSVEIVRDLVENWREVAFVVERLIYVFGPFIALQKVSNLSLTKNISELYKSSMVLSPVMDAISNKLDSWSSRSKAAAFNVKMLKGFLKSLAAAGTVAAIGAIVGVIFELWRVSTKARREAKELEKNLNAIYSEDTANLKKSVKEFENLTTRLKNANKGSQEHREIISKLNSQYGEYIGYIVDETTSYDKLKASIESVNKALIAKAKMNTFEKAFSATMEKTSKQMADARETLTNAILAKDFKTTEGLGIIPSEKEINDIFNLLAKNVKEHDRRLSALDFWKVIEDYGLKVNNMAFFDMDALTSFSNAVLEQKEAELKLDREINGVYDEGNVSTLAYRKEIEKLNEKYNKDLAEAKKLEGVSPSAYKKQIANIKKNFEKEKIKLQVRFEGLDDSVAAKRIASLDKFGKTVMDINKKIAESVDVLGEEYADLITIGEGDAAISVGELAKATADSYKLQMDIVKQQNALKSVGTQYDEKALEHAQKAANAYKFRLQLLGRMDLIESKSSSRAKSTTDILSKQLSLLKSAHQEYNKLKETRSSEDAAKEVAKNYKAAFSELKLGDITEGMTFDEKGIISVLDRLLKRVDEKGRAAVEKMRAEFASGIDIDVRIRSIEDAEQQMNKAFDGYELSLELESAGIPKGLAEKFSNIEMFDKKQLEDFVNSYGKVFSQFGEKGLESYKKNVKRLREIDKKESEERIKRYAKYLQLEVSQRINVEREAAKKIKEIQEEQAFTPTMKSSMIGNVIEEMQDKIDKLNWDSFKESDLYIQMFGELEYVSTNALDTIREKLINLRDTAKNLDPSELKEIQTQLAKIEDESVERNPFKGFKKSIRESIQALKGLKEQQEKLTNAQNDQDLQKNVVDSIQRQVDAQREKNAEIQSSKKASKEEKEISQAILDAAEKNLEVALKEYAVKKGITEEEAKKVLLMQQQVSNGEKTMKNVGAYGSAAVDSIGKLQGMLENWGVDFGEEFSGVLEGLGEVFGGLEQIDLTKPMSIISGAVSMVAGIGNAFASIFGAGNKDKKKEKQIKKEIKLVENLQKQYEKLEKAIDNAYAINEYERGFQLSKENLEQQIAATERMIKLEEDKKKTDHARIDEYKQNIEEYQDMLKELERKRLEDLGGIGSDEAYKNGAEAFVEAWMDAFRETGDGLEGLNDQFDEFLNNAIKKQLIMRATKQYLSKFYEEFDKMFAEESEGGGNLSRDEIDSIKDMWSNTSVGLSEMLESLAKSLGVISDLKGNSGGLDNLQESIQGITESTAQILESYLNSVRLFVADSNKKLETLVGVFSNDVNANPILAQLQTIARQTSAINSLLNTLVRGGHSMGGYGLKVFLN